MSDLQQTQVRFTEEKRTDLIRLRVERDLQTLSYIARLQLKTFTDGSLAVPWKL